MLQVTGLLPEQPISPACPGTAASRPAAETEESRARRGHRAGPRRGPQGPVRPQPTERCPTSSACSIPLARPERPRRRPARAGGNGLASPADAKWRLRRCIYDNILALLPHSSIDESTMPVDEALPAMDGSTGASQGERRRSDERVRDRSAIAEASARRRRRVVLAGAHGRLDLHRPVRPGLARWPPSTTSGWPLTITLIVDPIGFGLTALAHKAFLARPRYRPADDRRAGGGVLDPRRLCCRWRSSTSSRTACSPASTRAAWRAPTRSRSSTTPPSSSAGRWPISGSGRMSRPGRSGRGAARRRPRRRGRSCSGCGCSWTRISCSTR